MDNSAKHGEFPRYRGAPESGGKHDPHRGGGEAAHVQPSLPVSAHMMIALSWNDGRCRRNERSELMPLIGVVLEH